MKKFLFLNSLFICCVSLFASSSTDISLKIKKLSFIDRYCIETFFEEAIRKDQAAHVLFFNQKPVSLISIAIKYKHKKIKDHLILKGWEAFKKNGHFFNHPNFIFSEHIFELPDDFKMLQVYLINKRTLKICTDKHFYLFQKILGSNFSSKAFIAALENGTSLPDLIKKDESLMGLILGYGKESAEAYEQMISLYSENMPPPQTETYCRIDLNTPKGCAIHPVVFMGNPQSKEVQELKCQYEKELEDIWKRSKGKKLPLNLILEQLTREPEKQVCDESKTNKSMPVKK